MNTSKPNKGEWSAIREQTLLNSLVTCSKKNQECYVWSEKDVRSEERKLCQLPLRVKGKLLYGANYMKDPNYWARNRPGPPWPDLIQASIRLPCAKRMASDWESSTKVYMQSRYGKYLPENPLGEPKPGPPPKNISETLRVAIVSSGLRR